MVLHADRRLRDQEDRGHQGVDVESAVESRAADRADDR